MKYIIWPIIIWPNLSKVYHTCHVLYTMNKKNSQRMGGEPTAKKSSLRWFLKNLQIDAEQAWFEDYGCKSTVVEEAY